MRQRLVSGLWFLMWLGAAATTPWWMDDAVALAARFGLDHWEQPWTDPAAGTDVTALGEPVISNQDWSRGLNVLNAWKVANSALARVSRAFDREGGPIRPSSAPRSFYEPEQDVSPGPAEPE